MKKREAYSQYANNQLNQCTRYSNLAIVSESKASNYFSSKDDCHISIQRMCIFKEIVESKTIANKTETELETVPGKSTTNVTTTMIVSTQVNFQSILRICPFTAHKHNNERNDQIVLTLPEVQNGNDYGNTIVSCKE